MTRVESVTLATLLGHQVGGVSLPRSSHGFCWGWAYTSETAAVLTGCLRMVRSFSGATLRESLR